MFGGYHWEACSFLKRHGGAVNLEERRGWGQGLGIMEGGEVVVRMYERRIEKKRGHGFEGEIYAVIKMQYQNLLNPLK